MSFHRNSEVWMPSLEELGDSFYTEQLNSRLVRYHKNNFKAINDLCNTLVIVLKNEMFPESLREDDCLLDWHKVFAVHVLAVLKNQLYTDNGKIFEGNAVDRLANEFYCLLLLKIIARSWYRSEGMDCELVISDEYEWSLIKIFYKYKQSGLLNVRDSTFVYALANVAYLVERCFLVDNGKKI
jgi:hypothetical protein